MFNLEQWLFAFITSNATLQALLPSPAGSNTTYNVYPMGVNISPEQFPAITYYDYGSTLVSATKMHIGRLAVDCWSINSFEEMMQIYTALATIVNFQHSSILSTPVPNNGTLFWIREEQSKDAIAGASTRRQWRKTVVFKYWYINANLT